MSATTISALSTVASVVGTAASAYGQYAKGRTEQSVRESNAEIVLQKSKFEEEKSRKKSKYLMGTQRMLYAKAGVDISSGSPLAVMAYTAQEAGKEAGMIAWGGETEAEQQRAAGRAAERAGKIGGVSTFLTGLSVASTQYAKQKSK